MRIGATLGLGLAYANSKRDTVVRADGVVDQLRQVLVDARPSASAEIKGLASLSLGLILVGTADSEAASDMLTYLMEALDYAEPNLRFAALGIALIFLGKRAGADDARPIIDSVSAKIFSPIFSYILFQESKYTSKRTIPG